VNEREEHRSRWADDVAAYALGALEEREAALLEAHLAECEQCTAELGWLQPAVDILPASVEQVTPPPALRARLLETVREEAEPAAERAPAKRERRLRLPLFGPVSLRPVLAAAAVLLLAVAVTGYALTSGGDDGPPPETFTAAVGKPGEQVRATLEVDGDEGVLHIEGMPPNKPNQVYQAWIQEPAGSVGKSEVHPSSVFVVAESGTGDVSIPHGLEGADKVMITREPKGGSEVPSESPVMTLEMS